MAGRETPPERLEAGAYYLRRLVPDDAPLVARAVSESLDHLRPYMPWARPEMATVEAQRQRLAAPEHSWVPGSPHYSYGVFAAGDGSCLLGSCGLHDRRGPGALEIGYWVHAAHVRRGIATAAARAMTGAGFTLRGIAELEILCDVSNRASAAIPRALGYRLVETIEHAAEAPSETGKRLVWVMRREDWCGASGG